MAWEGSTTGQGSTSAWRKVRAEVLRRDGHRCRLQHDGCTLDAAEVHHVRSVASTTSGRRADAIDPRDCVAACHSCHQIETRRQAAVGRTRWKRRTERHPGLI